MYRELVSSFNFNFECIFTIALRQMWIAKSPSELVMCDTVFLLYLLYSFDFAAFTEIPNPFYLFCL